MIELGSFHNVKSVTSLRCWPACGGSLTLLISTVEHGDITLQLFLGLGLLSDETGADQARRCIALHLALGGKPELINRAPYCDGKVQPEHIEAALAFSEPVSEAVLTELRGVIG